MDDKTLEFLTANAMEFCLGAIGGAIVGYSSMRFGKDVRLVDRAESSKLGYATMGAFSTDLLLFGASKTGLIAPRTLQGTANGDVGSIIGIYLGLHLGKLVDRGLARLYGNGRKEEEN